MSHVWPFAKYAGCGNDFILFDNRQQSFPLSANQIRALCHRQLGIGADGILLLELSAQADCTMRIFNADGSEAEMCGNGLRCFAKWISTLLNGHRTTFIVEVMNSFLKVTLENSSDIKIEMANPHHFQHAISFLDNGKTFEMDFVNTGVPHAVIFTTAIDKIALEDIGPKIRFDPIWGSAGANVNLCERVSERVFKIRTYERGVERETLACGTGAVATALIVAKKLHLSSPITMITKSLEKLVIEFSYLHGHFEQVTLTGPVKKIFEGRVALPF